MEKLQEGCWDPIPVAVGCAEVEEGEDLNYEGGLSSEADRCELLQRLDNSFVGSLRRASPAAPRWRSCVTIPTRYAAVSAK